MERAAERLATVIGVIAGLLFLGLFVANVVNITARYLFGLSYIWIPDLSRIFFTWMVFLGGTAAYIRKQHLIIDFVRDRLPPKASGPNDLLINLALAGLFVVMIVKGARITAVRMNIPYDSWDVVPTAVAYVAVPVTGALMLLATVSRLVAAVRRPARHPHPGPPGGRRSPGEHQPP